MESCVACCVSHDQRVDCFEGRGNIHRDSSRPSPFLAAVGEIHLDPEATTSISETAFFTPANVPWYCTDSPVMIVPIRQYNRAPFPPITIQSDFCASVCQMQNEALGRRKGQIF